MYFEQDGYPFKCSYQRPGARRLPDDGIEYRELVNKLKAESAKREAELEAQMKPAQEYEAKIQAELRAMAEERIAMREVK